MPVMFSPPKKTLPAVGVLKPEMILNSVVLPAPFGPMIAVMPRARHVERDVFEGDEAAEPPRDVVEPQDAHAGFLRGSDDSSFGSEAMPPGA